MSRCRFSRAAPGYVVCRACGRTLKAPPRLRQIDQPCPEGDEDVGPHDGALCVHRGRSLGFRTCDECGSRGDRQEVFGCAVHGVCANREGVRKAVSCRWCRDFARKPPAP